MAEMAEAESSVEGSTRSSTSSEEDSATIGKRQGRKKRLCPSKRWAFTYHNYSENWMEELADLFRLGEVSVGEEVTKEGTPHLQGYVHFRKQMRPFECKGLPKKMHWEKCRGDEASNLKYTQKEGKFFSTFDTLPLELPDIQLYGWQLELWAELKNPPNNRSIYWVWSEHGERGKSTMARWLVQNKDAIICSGKAADMKFMIASRLAKDATDYPRFIIFDVPRSMAGYISYSGMEEIKNGVFASTKYESCTCVIPFPHVIVFANADMPYGDGRMSADRWRRWCVDDESVIEQRQCEDVWRSGFMD